MGRKEVLDLLIEGGKASPGPTTAPRLSVLKVNIQEIFNQLNEKTKSYAGMQVPVKLSIDADTKEFEITVGTPPVSALIKKEIGVELAKITEEEKTAGKTSVGNIMMEQIVRIAKMKMDNLLVKDLKTAAKVVVGTCASMPMTVEDKKAKEVAREIDEGKYDKFFA